MTTATKVRSGWCNPTLPRTKAYDPHSQCRGCPCECHQGTALDTPSGVIVSTAEPATDEWFAARDVARSPLNLII